MNILLRLSFLAITLASIFSIAAVPTAMSKDAHPMQIDDLFRLARVSDPQLNPSGNQIVYQVTKITDASKNAKSTQLWLVEANKSPLQITHSGKADSHARWSPDGSKILFESNRSGVSQLYIMDLTTGGEADTISNVENFVLTANNDLLTFDTNALASLGTVDGQGGTDSIRINDLTNDLIKALRWI